MTETQLYNAYRPRLFKHFGGNDDLIFKVKKQLEGNIPHTWLITGTTNSGKTSLGRLIARKLLNVSTKEDILQHRDYQEVNASVNRSIESIRQLVDNLSFKPKTGEYKVILIDEIHKLLDASASALLKALEEPPKHVIVIIATDQPEKLLQTIKNRAYGIHLQPLNQKAMTELLLRVAEGENIKWLTETIAEKFAKTYEGQPRQCLTQIQALCNSFIGTKIDQKEFEKTITDALHNDLQTVMCLLVAIYSDKAVETCQWSQKINDASYSVKLLLDLNHYLICRATSAMNDFGLINATNKQLWNSLKPVRNTLTLEKLLIVQDYLLSLRKELLLENINNPKHLLLFSFTKCVMSLKAVKGSK